MKAVIILIIILLVLLAGCGNKEVIERQRAYEKCTLVCASVVGEDYTVMHLCNEECKKEFLGENSTKI